MKIRIGKSKRLNERTLWYAAVDASMVKHLSPQLTSELCNKLSDAVNKLGQEYHVGREYKDGQLIEGWHN
jgi:hypothetical protein